MTCKKHIAVIGAGIAGLACARLLHQAGCTVSVFDKSRGCGGRTASRRDNGLRFDHGAQFFSVRDGAFAATVDEARSHGACAMWEARFQRLVDGERIGRPRQVRWVGCDGMSGLAKFIGRALSVQTRTRVATIERERDRWSLYQTSGTSLGRFDAVAVAVPAPQAAALLAPLPALATEAERARLAPCWAVMAALREPLIWPVDALAGEHAVLAWAARNASKPRRPATPDTWVLHATPAWSRTNLEDLPDTVAASLFDAFSGVIGARVQATHLRAHRWRYARVTQALNWQCLVDTEALLGACGDWCLGPRVESAFLSGQALARRFMAALNLSPAG